MLRRRAAFTEPGPCALAAHEPLRDVLHDVMFEPGRFLPSSLYGKVLEMVPAEDAELLGASYELLTSKLARSPEATLDAVLDLLD